MEEWGGGVMRVAWVVGVYLGAIDVDEAVSEVYRSDRTNSLKKKGFRGRLTISGPSWTVDPRYTA